MKKIIVYISFLLLASCGGISLISRGNEDLYTPEFTKLIERAKGAYAAGSKDTAIKQLEAIQDEPLLPTEIAMKKNLIGVIKFSESDFEQAIYNFNMALTTSSLDEKLTAQIHLNLASSYYRLGDTDNTLSTLLLCNFKKLEGKEFQNYHKLRFNVAKDLGRKKISIESLFWMLSKENDLVVLKSSQQFSELVTLYFSLEQQERIRFVKDLSDEKTLIAGYLTYLEVEQLYNQAKREEATNLAQWITRTYQDVPGIVDLANNFLSRIENFASLNQRSIGIVLPLSADGQKGIFAKRALAGIDHAIRTLNEKNANTEGWVPLVLEIADSVGSAVVGKRRVAELIESKNVSLLIGGLFSNEAVAEYEMAKKYGTFFISLSQVFIDKLQKNHLLIEVPGSVESQISVLIEEKFLSSFGKKSAIIFPDTERGRAYVDEFWRKASESGASVVGVHVYDSKNTDQRDTVQKLLGLKYKRERQEELEILEELHELEGATSIRRIQTLKPEVDFDWAFIPSTPDDALQIIPSFGYFDAFNVPLIGDPSWRSTNISKESYKLGRLYFVDGDVPKGESDFVNGFKRRNQESPRIVELLGYEAFEIANNILGSGEFKSRGDLEQSLISANHVTGLTGDWILKENVWLKKMNLMNLYRGKTSKMRLEEVKAE